MEEFKMESMSFQMYFLENDFLYLSNFPSNHQPSLNSIRDPKSPYEHISEINTASLVDLLTMLFRGHSYFLLCFPLFSDIQFGIMKAIVIRTLKDKDKERLHTKKLNILYRENRKEELIHCIVDILKKQERKKDEEYKFIFHRVIDRLKKNFFEEKENKQFIQQPALERNKLFWSHYAFPVNGEDRGGVSDYPWPCHFEQKRNYLRAEYLKKLFSNEKFKEDFLNTMEEHVREDHVKTYDKKFKTVLDTLKCKLCGLRRREQKNFIKDFFHNPMNKLPWSVYSIEKAKISLRKKIHKIN